MNHQYWHDGGTLRSSALAVVTATLGRIPPLVYLILVVLLVGTQVVGYIATNPAQRTMAVLALAMFQLVAFAQIGSFLRQQSNVLIHRLTPWFSHSHVVAAILLLASIAVLPALVHLHSGSTVLLIATGTSLLAATLALYVMAGHVMLRLNIVAFGFLGYTVWSERVVNDDIWYATVQDTFVVHGSVIGVALWLLALLFLFAWHRTLSRSPLATGTGLSSRRRRRIVDFSSGLKSPAGARAVTGYLFTPAFCKLERFDEKPHWWWLRFAVTDPGLSRSGLFWLIVVLGMAFLSGDADSRPLVTAIMVLILAPSAADTPYRAFAKPLRRLYLQSSAPDRRSFRMEVLKADFFGSAVVLGLMMAIILIADWSVPEETFWLSLSLATLIAYCAPSILYVWLHIKGVKCNTVVYIVNYVAVVAVCMILYMQVQLELMVGLMTLAVLALLVLLAACLSMFSWARIDRGF